MRNGISKAKIKPTLEAWDLWFICKKLSKSSGDGVAIMEDLAFWYSDSNGSDIILKHVKIIKILVRNTLEV
jgi:hypothetical protein